MTLALGPDQEALARTARAWCASAGRAGAWDAQVAMGWPTLGVDFGLGELAVVLEEAGRSGLGGPLVPTALTALAVDRLGGAAARGRLAGGATAAVAFASAPLDARPDTDGHGVVVDGEATAVLGADGAELLLLPVEGGWVVVEGRDAKVAVAPSTDLDRPVASVRVDGVRVPADGVLRIAAGTADPVPALAAVVLSAEAIGIAAWCVETAAAYARERVQFGRPIGQFQAVKHRCADMLASLERARAAVWDAARGGDDAGWPLAVAAAATLAPAAAVAAAKDCIQVLGGIGFTWEHDAHRFLRRALATRSLLPPASAWRAQAVSLVGSGVTRSVPLDLPPEAEPIRAEVRAFVESLRSTPRESWNDRIVDAGYLVPHWPRPWGRDAGPLEQVVVDEELRQAGVRRAHLQVAAWTLPTLVAHGTPEQQERWMLPSMRQQLRWCQLFSEPEAGSDLASLRTRAVRVDGGWSLTGQKVWTSMADSADWGICLARTSPDKPPHEGITCFFVDMASPGIEIRPLKELTGEAWFNEVFLDEVFVPDDCVIGGVDDGWRAGRTTLANERVSMGSGASIGAGVAALVGLLAGGSASPVDVDRVGQLVAADHALGALRLRMTLRALAGADAGPEASVTKLLGVLHDQDVQEAGVELLGPLAAAADGEAAGWVRSFLWNRCLSIAGGTSEIQRNVIAERLLALPRDP